MSQPPQGTNPQQPPTGQPSQPQGQPPQQPPYGQPQQPPYGQPQPYGAAPYGPAQPYGTPAARPGQSAPQPVPGQPARAWGQAPYPGTPAPGPYPGPPGQPPYGYPAGGYPAAGYPAAAPKRQAGKGLGVAGFVMVLVGAAAGGWGAWMLGDAFVRLIIRLGIPPQQWEHLTPSDIPDAELSALGVSAMPALVACLVGIVGWILCIVATAKGSARPLAIIGIVLGVLAPIALYFAFAMGIAGALGAM